LFIKKTPQFFKKKKIFLKIFFFNKKKKISGGGGGVVFKIKYSSTKPVPHLSMKIYE